MTLSNAIWSAKDAIAITGGHCSGIWSVTGISINAHMIKQGDLFVALADESGDGHDDVVIAFAKGARAAMVSRYIEGVPSDKLLIVDDTLLAIEKMAIAARARTGARTIAVISDDKDTSADMLGLVLTTQGQTHASDKNNNTLIHLASMHAGTDYGVFEINTKQEDHNPSLLDILKPDIVIIKNGYSISNISLDGISKNGAIIIHQDHEKFVDIKSKAERKGFKIYSYGKNSDAHAYMIDCLEAANGSRIKASILEQEISFSLQVAGRKITYDALATLLGVKIAGGNIEKASKALIQYEGNTLRGKSEYIDSGVLGNPITLIDESYNASPASMAAAFKVLALVDPGRGGRRIAILGDMLVLGHDSAQMHADLALPLKAANVDLVYTCGKHMKKLYENLPANQRGEHKESSKELAEIVPDVLIPGDVVMVKGSLGSKVELVVEALRALPEKLKHIKKV